MNHAWLLNTGLMLILAGCGGVKETADAGQTDGPLPDKVLPKPDLVDTGSVQKDGVLDGLSDGADGGDGPGSCGNSVIDTGEKCDGLNLAGWTCTALGFAGGTLKCNKDCSDYDKSGCYKCGDGKITSGEKCDGTNLAGWDCKGLGFDGGTLKCKADCSDLDKSACTMCGDFVKNGAEECDGADLGSSTCKALGYYGGKLTCDAKCKLIKTACTNCGNAKVDTGEQCDGKNLNSKTCKTEGFDGGVLKCAGTCTFDKSYCTKATCPNGKLEPGEDCEGSNLNNKKCTDLKYAGGMLACYGNCKYDTSKCYKCGDANINTGEQCDGANLGGWSCKALNYDGGGLKCKTDCKDFDKAGCYKCGDAKKNGTEQCDGTDLGGKACMDVGYYAGTLTCKKDCSLDTAQCNNCGNTKIETGEDCDGSNLNSKTCKDFKFDKGTLKCSSTCLFDKSGCQLIKCGDGKVDGAEQCDGTNLDSKTCKGLGYDGGSLACTKNCKLDAAKCHKCGDGKLGGTETCDGAALAGKSCSSFSPFHSGTLKCKSDCSGYDTTSCNKCGDKSINGTEKCDGAQLGLATCNSLGFDGGTLSCTTGCLLDTSNCTKCGDGKINGTEKCDGSQFGTTSCGSLGFGGGNLKCTSGCALDTTNCTPPYRYLADEFFADFRQGTLSESGAKLYVSARGNVQMVDRLDLNNDGNLDLVFSNGGDGKTYKINSYIYWGSKIAKDYFSASNRAELPTVGARGNSPADLNDDGYPDIVFCNMVDGSKYPVNSYIYWGSAGPYSTANRTDLPTLAAHSNTVADLNRDGYLDIVFGNTSDGTTSSINSYIYWGSGAGFVKSNRAELPTINTWGNAVADLNKDGYLDIVFSSWSGSAYIYYGSASGFATTNRKTLAAGKSTVGTSVADFNGDSYLDIVFSVYANATVDSYIYKGSASGFSDSNRQALPVFNAVDNSVADLNEDGYLDIVFNSHMKNNVTCKINSMIYWGSKTGYTSSYLPTVGSYGNVVADFNSDGYQDIVFSNNADNSVGYHACNLPNTNSFIYWGSSGGTYSSSLRTDLPTVGAYRSTTTDAGSVYDRKPVQTFTSRAMDAVTAAPVYDQLTVKATVPKNTTLKLQLRSATTTAGLSTAPWYGPTSTSDHYEAATGTKTFTLNNAHKDHRYIQYQAVFFHDFGSTPVLDRVEIKFHTTSTCAKTSCTDKTQNGCETDVDCGGEVCNGCADSKKCKTANDCLGGVCSGGVCKAGCAHQPVVNRCRTDGQGLKWCSVPSGCYKMGSPSTESCRYSKETQRDVTLTHKFEIQSTEVTQDQFYKVMGYKPWKFTSCGGTCPVEQVSWYEAAAYANALSAKAGLTKCYTCSGSGSSVTCQETTATQGKSIYSCKGYRLPTEAEWEYAYRAGTTSVFYNGGITSCTGKDPNLEKIGWYDQNSSSTTHPVGKKTPNAWGLYDMAGNVFEWCHDWSTTYPSTSVSDPVGTSGSSRVSRGGSWLYSARYCRAAFRDGTSPGIRDDHIGFRLARSVP